MCRGGKGASLSWGEAGPDPSSRPAQQTTPAGALVLDVQAPELRKKKFLLSKPPSLTFCHDGPGRMRQYLED